VGASGWAAGRNPGAARVAAATAVAARNSRREI